MLQRQKVRGETELLMAACFHKDSNTVRSSIPNHQRTQDGYRGPNTAEPCYITLDWLPWQGSDGRTKGKRAVKGTHAGVCWSRWGFMP